LNFILLAAGFKDREHGSFLCFTASFGTYLHRVLWVLPASDSASHFGMFMKKRRNAPVWKLPNAPVLPSCQAQMP
jgi:hypothetical protein